ncbi:Ku70/Ku80 beta-barrel domain protein [Ancylostoma ceylanicum]|uniref:Ku70/Ku80 beta-barrel domain protein n=2 Tax=Ancylostoma ceylanicum TaxID=53326 RepID=A0A0D6LVG1_9BILA|nr:Ku70/Ku80 beta-barrel domain protein [Ancylostoma ceylanicum]
MYTKSIPAKNPLKSVLVNEQGVEMHRQSRFLANIKTEGGTGDVSASQFKELNEKEQRILGKFFAELHYFGDTKVPIAEEDEKRYKGHNFNEGETRGCMKLIQFTKRENIKECYFIGHNSFVVVPGWEKKTSDRDVEAMRTTLSIISAMLENDVVAICRYAPDAAKHLQLMALIPHKDDELDLPYLQALRLPFAEDMRPFNFVSLNATCPKPNHNQLNLVDELIDAMQFNAENGSLEPECVLNPFFQRQCTAMKLKALNTISNGDDMKICDLIAPSPFLKRGLEPDSKMLESARHILNAMQSDESGFSLQEVVKVKRPKQEIRQEDISEWLAELEATQKEEVVENPKGVKKATQGRFVDRARARLSDNFEFHMASLLDEVSVMTAAEDEEAAQLFPNSLVQIAHARLMSLRLLAIEFDRPVEYNEWLLFSKSQWPEWAQFCASRYFERAEVPYLSVASELQQLSTTLPRETDAVPVKEVLRRELESSPHDVFPVPTTVPMGICDVVQEAANQRVIIEESRNSVPAEQIMALTTELLRTAKTIDSIGEVVPVSRLWEFVNLVMAEISNKLTWENSMKDSPYYYAVFIERYVFLHLDPQRTGKVPIADLTSTRLLDDLFDVVFEQNRESKEQLWDVSQLSWCSINNFWRALEQFRRCDRDWSGMVSLEECQYLKDGAYTPLFLERVFATQMLYGDPQKVQEMDFRGFVELDAAIHTRKESASIKWLFRVLDLRDDGVLDRNEIKMMTESMLKNLATLEGWSNFNPDDIADEVIDMIHPQDPNGITVDEVIASRMADTAFGILIDYHAFLKYENREEEAAT